MSGVLHIMLQWTWGDWCFWGMRISHSVCMYPVVDVLGHMTVLFLDFGENMLFSTMNVLIYIPLSSLEGFFYGYL